MPTPTPDRDLAAGAADDDTEQVTDRRRFVRRLGLGAAAVATGALATTAGAGTAAASTPALATGTRQGTAGTTQLDYVGNPRRIAFMVQSGEFHGTNATANPAAIAGFAARDGVLRVGAHGHSDVVHQDAIGLHGTAPWGVGVVASGGRANLHLVGGGPEPARRQPTTHQAVVGDVVVDGRGGLWFCVAGGSPGEWRQVSGPTTAGAFHVLDPTRVYDSRRSGGRLAAGRQRVVEVSHGIAPVVRDVVPPGATAVTANVAVFDTTGGGFLRVTPGDATSASATTVSWAASRDQGTNGTVLKLAADRTIKLWGYGAATQVVIDVTGYYL